MWPTALILLTMAWTQNHGVQRQLEPCPTRIASLVPDLGFNPLSLLKERVEIRSCSTDALPGFLQFVAWAEGGKTPSLVVDTDDILIGRLVVLGNIFVIVTNGQTVNVVYVITYDNGIPALALKRPTRGTLVISTDEKSVSITVAEPGGDRSNYAFSLSNRQAVPRAPSSIKSVPQ